MSSENFSNFSCPYLQKIKSCEKRIKEIIAEQQHIFHESSEEKLISHENRSLSKDYIKNYIKKKIRRLNSRHNTHQTDARRSDESSTDTEKYTNSSCRRISLSRADKSTQAILQRIPNHNKNSNGRFDSCRGETKSPHLPRVARQFSQKRISREHLRPDNPHEVMRHYYNTHVKVHYYPKKMIQSEEINYLI